MSTNILTPTPPTSATEALALELRGVHKSFASVEVLKGVDLLLGKGKILALLGENGAGKTTLMNILGGVLAADSGRILIDGAETAVRSPAAAREHGIAFVHQELNVVNDLKVYENVFLGEELRKSFSLDVKRMIARTAEILERLEVDIDPCAKVSRLDASYKQVVEIAGALQKEAKIIIFDEPTSALTNVEIDVLFGVMRTLKKHGASMIFISHKLNEVLEICDSYLVMRDGMAVAHDRVRQPDGKTVATAELAKHMVGKTVLNHVAACDVTPGGIVLEARGLGDGKHFFDIDFQVRRHEIVGLTGLLGDGRSELARCLFGCRKTYDGSILVDGKAVRVASETAAKNLGIGYIPGNRKENGIIPLMSVKHNFSLAYIRDFTRYKVIQNRRETAACLKSVADLNTKTADINNRITSLSGGNQQKVVLAKWLQADLKVLLLDNPTQGVDVGAKADIYGIIAALARAGLALVVVSSEAQEIMCLCDRVYVMHQGRISGMLERRDMSEDKIMLLATTPGEERTRCDQ